ncbi:hypothetical protein [Burkholderia sp. 22313]|uniref:hypothetical protein n=1 Tax=Burkholderia sp. 22313 TaxID=3453908 RepID=UPI003F86A14E
MMFELNARKCRTGMSRNARRPCLMPSRLALSRSLSTTAVVPSMPMRRIVAREGYVAAFAIDVRMRRYPAGTARRFPSSERGVEDARIFLSWDRGERPPALTGNADAAGWHPLIPRL